jgi:hypothetical protein
MTDPLPLLAQIIRLRSSLRRLFDLYQGSAEVRVEPPRGFSPDQLKKISVLLEAQALLAETEAPERLADGGPYRRALIELTKLGRGEIWPRDITEALRDADQEAKVK